MKQNKGLYIAVLILILILTATVVFFTVYSVNFEKNVAPTPSATESSAPEPTPEQLTYKEITLLSAGDLM